MFAASEARGERLSADLCRSFEDDPAGGLREVE
jgi:hypothetical protein